MIRRIYPIAFAALLALAGCATAPSEGPDTSTSQQATEEGQEGAAAEGAATEGTEAGATATGAADCPPNCDFARNEVDDPASVLSDRTIYFEFDSSKVQQEYMDIIKRHSSYLTQYPDVDVRLEGHTDERGSREYNVGLGARRAESVAQLLQAYGVAKSQMETISYGEEVPAVEGHNEDAWSKNRRVELVYSGGGS